MPSLRSPATTPAMNQAEARKQRIFEAWAPDIHKCREEYNSGIAMVMAMARDCELRRENDVAALIRDIRETIPTFADELLYSELGSLLPQNRIDFAELARVLGVEEIVHGVSHHATPQVEPAVQDDMPEQDMTVDSGIRRTYPAPVEVAPMDIIEPPVTPPYTTRSETMAAEAGPSNGHAYQVGRHHSWGYIVGMHETDKRLFPA